ncbi:MAG: hypothetical protein K9G41_10190 [Flavobacteriales bacterium]|nr:hypothetical protein [Flavobacteriales bacterium]
MPKITRKTGKSMVLKARFLFSVLLFFIAFQGVAQVSFESQEELEKAANSFFDAAEYDKAKPLFSQLLSKDALNPDYNYRFGVCILFTEADPLKPLPYIEGGASTKGVNAEAHYFLGKAFQFNYRFDDAIKSYEKGKSVGLSKPNIDLDRCIEECRNGKILYNPAIDFQPAMDKDVIENEFYRPYDFRKLKGKVIPMPPDFKTKYDEKNLVGTVIYTPTNSQTLIYASYGEDGANAKDLYQVNRLPNGELALPLRLPNTINTKYDEDYAFYDEESQILFFASKGHNSMGGYDVFSSKYNANNSTWSTPLNLQYPINSPYDDFLYVSDPEGQEAFFSTNRNVEAGKLRVMKTLLHNPQQVEVSVLEGTFIDKTDSVYNYAALTVIDPITNEVVGKYRSHKVTGKYLLILPPQNDYTMDVGPREANGFKFDLDVPQHDAVNPLQQAIVYEATGANGTITVTNYFDATGNSDTVKVAESRSLKEIEERMVAMPDPTELLAVKSQVDIKKKDSEQNALANAEKTNQEATKNAEELAQKEKQAAEEAAKQEELAKVAQARVDSIREAEKQALALVEKEASLKAEQAERAKLEAEALALKEKQAADEKVKLEELAKAEKVRLDSIREAKNQALALVEKEAAVKAEQALKAELEAAKQAEELALKEKQLTEEAVKAETVVFKEQEEAEKAIVQAELAKTEKAKADSNQQVETQALAKANKKAEELALEEKEAADEAARLAQLAKTEQALLDSIRAAEQQALASAEKEATELALQEEFKQAEQAALKEKLALEKAEKQLDSTKAEQAKELDFVAQAKENFKRDSIRQVEEFEKLQASHLEARVKRDSVNKAIELAKLKEAEEQVRKDSIAAAEEVMEQERLAQLEQLKERQDLLTQIKAAEVKAQLAKLKAEEENSKLQLETEKTVEEVIEATLETTPTAKTEDNPVVKPEVAEPAPLEIAEVEEVKSELVEAVAPTTKPMPEVKLAVDTPTTEVVMELDETEVLSESELFLQTIAKLEAQKREQQQLVDEENSTKKREQEQQKIALAETRLAADTSAVRTQTVGNVDLSSSTEIELADTSDIETMSVALKSDANPQEYLVALAEIEKKIAKDARANASKSYELKELPSKPEVNRNADPVLEAKIEADRQALAEHQKIAVEKEKALKEKMQRDKAEVELFDQASAKELAVVEKEIVQNLEEPIAKIEQPNNSDFKLEPIEEVKELVAPTEVTIISGEQPEPVVETTKKSEVDQEVLDALAEFDRILAGTESPENAAENAKVELSEEATVEVLEIKTEEPEVSIASEPAVMDTVIDSKPQLIEKEEIIEVAVVEEIQPLNEPEEVDLEIAEMQVEEIKQELDKPKQASTGTVGTIPFLTAAKRNYSTEKPSFNKIEDVSMRRMVQRMRAEDVGRMAVLKNMKNEWVDAGKTSESLKDIKSNTRNKDVLETVAAAPSREEYIRPPFDKNSLRKRQDVYYKLEFTITTAGVSQAVSEAMTPEQAISFAMPEFEVQTSYYQTLADATSDFKEYQRRGFNSVRIIPYLKNEQVTLSDVSDIPFVD